MIYLLTQFSTNQFNKILIQLRITASKNFYILALI